MKDSGRLKGRRFFGLFGECSLTKEKKRRFVFKKMKTVLRNRGFLRMKATRSIIFLSFFSGRKLE